jgi:hypothetical protein
MLKKLKKNNFAPKNVRHSGKIPMIQKENNKVVWELKKL